MATETTQPTPSSIVRVLNEDVGRYHRWCTPSILPDQERVQDFYASDVSISAGFFGTLVDHTGVFADAEKFAAQAQGADRTMFSVHGSSGSNWIVLRMLALEHSDALVLVARNIHHSVINGIKAFGLDFRFLPTPYEPRFEAVLPPSVDDVLDGMARYPEALAVLYTSPTYEGLAANTRAIADAVHAASDTTMLIVDEAWGGHLRVPSRPARERDGLGRGHLRAVDPQARGRPAADGPHPLAGAARRLRADGGGLPRVRHHVAQLPPAGQRRRRRPHAGRARAATS